MASRGAAKTGGAPPDVLLRQPAPIQEDADLADAAGDGAGVQVLQEREDVFAAGSQLVAELAHRHLLVGGEGLADGLPPARVSRAGQAERRRDAHQVSGGGQGVQQLGRGLLGARQRRQVRRREAALVERRQQAVGRRAARRRRLSRWEDPPALEDELPIGRQPLEQRRNQGRGRPELLGERGPRQTAGSARR